MLIIEIHGKMYLKAGLLQKPLKRDGEERLHVEQMFLKEASRELENWIRSLTKTSISNLENGLVSFT